MINVITTADIFYVDGNGKEAITHYTGKDKSGYLELAEDMAKSVKVTRVRVEVLYADDNVAQTTWYNMKNGKLIAGLVTWG